MFELVIFAVYLVLNIYLDWTPYQTLIVRNTVRECFNYGPLPPLGQVPLHSPHRDGHQAGGVCDADPVCGVHYPGIVGARPTIAWILKELFTRY